MLCKLSVDQGGLHILATKAYSASLPMGSGSASRMRPGVKYSSGSGLTLRFQPPTSHWP